MKVTGQPPIPEAPSAEPAAEVKKAERPFAEALGTQPTAAPTDVPSVNSELLSGLAAGRITPEAAVERLLERIVNEQVGVGAPATIRDQIRAALRDAADGDPLVAEQIRRLRETADLKS